MAPSTSTISPSTIGGATPKPADFPTLEELKGLVSPFVEPALLGVMRYRYRSITKVGDPADWWMVEGAVNTETQTILLRFEVPDHVTEGGSAYVLSSSRGTWVAGADQVLYQVTPP